MFSNVDIGCCRCSLDEEQADIARHVPVPLNSDLEFSRISDDLQVERIDERRLMSL
ncbi:MAG: hypothetical protein ACK5T6_03415 [Pirellula sp.]